MEDNCKANFFCIALMSPLRLNNIKKIYQNFLWLYLGQMWAIEAMQVTLGGPDTLDDPRQRGAARTVARPLEILKKYLRNLQKSLNF